MKKLLKLSYFNRIYEVDGKCWIFNSFNLGLVEIPVYMLDILNKEFIELDNYSENEQEILEELEEVGVLVEQSIDEFKILKYLYNTDKYNKDYLSITILPTLVCNCACFYCFERENSIKNKINNIVRFSEIENDIVNYVESKLSDTKNLSIAWFGGEPLLTMDIIERLSERLIDLAEKYHVTYSASITTNGYYISEISNIVERFKKCKISSFQITLDGAPDEHNNIRKLKVSNGNTFDKMLEGIKILKENNLAVNVRINLNKINLKTINELFDIFEKNDLKKVKMYFGQFIDYSNQDNSHIYLNESEYAEAVSSLYMELRKRGFRYGIDDHYPSNARPCIANRIDAAVIDCYGNIYKCRSQIGEYEKSVGNVCQIDGQTEIEAMREIDWIERNPFKYAKCRACKMLPLCMGGCPYSLYDNNNAQPKCVEWKYNLDFFVTQKIRNMEVTGDD